MVSKIGYHLTLIRMFIELLHKKKKKKRDPVGVVCVDDYVQSSWQYGEWLRAAETLLAVWNLFSSAAVLGFKFPAVRGVCAVCVCSLLIYVLHLHDAQRTYTGSGWGSRGADIAKDTFSYVVYFNHWIFFLKALTDWSMTSQVKPKIASAVQGVRGHSCSLWEHYVYSHRMSSECWVGETKSKLKWEHYKC